MSNALNGDPARVTSIESSNSLPGVMVWDAGSSATFTPCAGAGCGTVPRAMAIRRILKARFIGLRSISTAERLAPLRSGNAIDETSEVGGTQARFAGGAQELRPVLMGFV